MPLPSSPDSPLPNIAELVDQELKQCLEHAAEGLHWVGPDGVILWANHTELALLGFTRDEYVGHHIAEFHVDRPVIDDIMARLTRGETLLNYEARLRHKDGSVRFVQINSNVLWRDGQFVHTRCFTRDITEQRLVDELALRLADIVEHSDDAIISQDLDGIITSWNPAAERIYGYTAHEAIGQPIRLIIPPEREHEEADVVRRVRIGERLPPFDTIRRRKDGARIEVALTISPIRDRDGRIVGASKMAREISARKRLEARDRFLVDLDETLRPLTDLDDLASTVVTAVGRHLAVSRCTYASVDDDEDTCVVIGSYTHGAEKVAGRYLLRQFGEECRRLMRSGKPFVLQDSERDGGLSAAERLSYAAIESRAVICVPILKDDRLVAAMAVYGRLPRGWQPDEVELVQRVASRCWESLERARVTQGMRESEHQFRALANSIANLAWMARPDGWIYWFNDQWYTYTGTTPEDMEGWGWERVHDPELLPMVKERWQHSIATGTPFEMVFPLRGADGTFRRFLTRVNPVRDSKGDVVHWFGTNTDVENERRATEVNAVLREREQRARQEAELQKRLLHSLFMQAPTLIAVLRGPEHVVELANPPVCQVWGRPESELVNRPLFEVMPELRDQVFRSLLDRVYKTGIPYVGKETPARLERPGGARRT